ncbi:MAG: peptide deformylase [Myxococcota bacterium]|jgi:peptide deformylase
MTIRKIASVGHPVLRQIAREVRLEELPKWQGFIDDLIETMRDANGAGLAANQVYEPIRICVIEVRANNPRYPEKKPIPLTIMVNPILTEIGTDTIETFEGCLSVPNLRGKVRRAAGLRVEFFDRDGQRIIREAHGIEAVTYQHECDHLDGKLFLDRVENRDTLTTWDNYSRFHSS